MVIIVRTWHRDDLKKFNENNKFLTSCFFGGKKVLFKESPPNIMVTRNFNQSTEILWYETGYAKVKILSPLKRPAWGRLYCWICFKLLEVCWLMLWWSTCNILDSDVSEYSTTDIFNSDVGKYYVEKKKQKTNSILYSGVSE